MPLEIVQLPLLSDNYAYLLHDVGSGETAVVDPSEAAPVLQALDERGWKLSKILSTHHHADHVGGNREIKARTNCAVYGFSEDASRIPGIDHALLDGDQVSVGDAEGEVLFIPGHTTGHIAYYFAHEKAVFCGDTLFSLGCGRLFEGTPAQMFASLQRLAALPGDTKVYCGHEYTQSNGAFALVVEPENDALKSYMEHVHNLRAKGLPTVPSTMETECECNPFIRAKDVAEFTQRRLLKDRF